jgi:hypothetical protein
VESPVEQTPWPAWLREAGEPALLPWLDWKGVEVEFDFWGVSLADYRDVLGAYDRLAHDFNQGGELAIRAAARFHNLAKFLVLSADIEALTADRNRASGSVAAAALRRLAGLLEQVSVEVDHDPFVGDPYATRMFWILEDGSPWNLLSEDLAPRLHAVAPELDFSGVLDVLRRYERCAANFHKRSDQEPVAAQRTALQELLGYCAQLDVAQSSLSSMAWQVRGLGRLTLFEIAFGIRKIRDHLTIDYAPMLAELEVRLKNGVGVQQPRDDMDGDTHDDEMDSAEDDAGSG